MVIYQEPPDDRLSVRTYNSLGLQKHATLMGKSVCRYLNWSYS